jgi:hypothetical protein
MSGIVGSLFNHRGSGVVSKLGTDGQSINSGGAGVKALAEDAAGGGAYTFIASSVGFSGVSEVIFSGISPSGYTRIAYWLRDIVGTTASIYMVVRFAVSGTTWLTSGYTLASTAGGSATAYDDNALFLNNSVHYSGQGPFNARGEQQIVGSSKKTGYAESEMHVDDGRLLYQHMYMGNSTTSNIVAIRFYPHAGTISGSIFLYGISES